jgi:deoxyribodipyrimidine photolyase
MKVSGHKKVDGGRETGVGMWVQELAWRDFYTHVMVAFPRSVSSRVIMLLTEVIVTESRWGVRFWSEWISLINAAGS